MQTMRLVISGDVQGVGYRSWFKRIAQGLGVFGWVKNRQDGAVEAIIQGNKSVLSVLIAQAKKGPDVGWVEQVEVDEYPGGEQYTSFEVVY